MRRLFAAIRNRTALRRTFSLVCAIAFLTVSVAHAVQHFEGIGTIGVAQAAVEATDDSAAPSKKATAPFEHCFACTMVALPLDGQTIVPNRAASDSARPAPRDVRQHPPTTETRPPIATA